jgi:large subunit ribosomal protein L15
VNVRDLARFPQGTDVGPDELKKAGLIKGRWDGIKILGLGELKHSLTVRANAFSAGARQKISAAGGKIVELKTGGEAPVEKVNG